MKMHLRTMAAHMRYGRARWNVAESLGKLVSFERLTLADWALVAIVTVIYMLAAAGLVR